MSTFTGSSMSGITPWYASRSLVVHARLVEKTPTTGPTDDPLHPFCVGEIAGGVTEIELCEVARKVLAADVMVRPIERPLQLREVVLGLVRGHVATHVLTRCVVDAMVRCETVSEMFIAPLVVRVQHRVRHRHVLFDDGAQVLAG